MAKQEEEAGRRTLRLRSVKKLTEGLPRTSVVLEDIQSNLANIKKVMPSKDSCLTKKKQQEDLEGTPGILLREGSGLLEKAGPALRMSPTPAMNSLTLQTKGFPIGILPQF